MPPYFTDPKTGVLRELTEAEWLAYPIAANELAGAPAYTPETGDNTAEDGL